MDGSFIELLRCPTARVPVREVTARELESVNSAIAADQVERADGTPVDRPLEQALITRDGRTLYAVEDGIPVLMPEAAIAAGQIRGLPDGDSDRPA